MNRLFQTIGLLACAVGGVMITVAPWAVFQTWLDIFSAQFPRREPTPVGYFGFLVVVLSTPVLLVDSIRASRLVRDDPSPPMTLMVLVLAVLCAPLYLPSLADAFGPHLAWYAVIAFWPVASLSQVTYVVALAQVAAAERNETVRYGALKFLHQMGGGIGIELVKRRWSDSPAVEDFPSGPPVLLLWLLGLALVGAYEAGFPVPVGLTRP
jgi:hypothetical protein